jgi:hypothetical protein
MQHVHMSDFISYCTVRIEAKSDSGVSCGTGFFFNFCNGQSPCIVTNKHVVEGSDEVVIYLSVKAKNEKHHKIEKINLGNVWHDFLKHPDVDLAALPIYSILQNLDKIDSLLRWAPINISYIPNNIEFENFLTIEDVTMVGYPNGIWDNVNNLPVIRRGITAMHPNINWKGQPEFIIDIAAFPGSSGSPVFIYNPGAYTERSGATIMSGGRLRLIGTLYAGSIHHADGSIEIIKIPTRDELFSRTQMPNNIGIVINSRCLLWFEKYIGELLALQRLR